MIQWLQCLHGNLNLRDLTHFPSQTFHALSIFTSARVHIFTVRGSFNSRVYGTAVGWLAADLHLLTWLTILSRSISAEIKLLTFQRFLRKQMQFKFYVWFDWTQEIVNLKLHEHDEASYRVMWCYSCSMGILSGEAISSLLCFVPTDSYRGPWGSSPVCKAKTNDTKEREQRLEMNQHCIT